MKAHPGAQPLAPDRGLYLEEGGSDASRHLPVAHGPMTGRAEAAVRNEVSSRDRNEWIDRTREAVPSPPVVELYVCECGEGDCSSRVRMTRDEYLAVRRYPTRFMIAADHEDPEVDQVLSEGPRFSVVQKIAGLPARIARETYRHTAALGDALQDS